MLLVCTVLFACSTITLPKIDTPPTVASPVKVDSWPEPTAYYQRVKLKNVIVGLVRTKDGTGTGFPIQRKDGKLRFLTAHHVLYDRNILIFSPETGKSRYEERKILNIELFRGGNSLALIKAKDIKRLGGSKDLDTAILEMPVPAIKDMLFIRLSADKPVVGERIVSFGCYVGIVPSFTGGYVTRQNLYGNNAHYWVSSCPTYMGGSGGPLINLTTSTIVGVCSAVLKDPPSGQIVTHVQYFVSAADIRKWLIERGYYE